MDIDSSFSCAFPETLSGDCGDSPSTLDTDEILDPSVAGIIVPLGSTSTFFCSAPRTSVSLAILVLEARLDPNEGTSVFVS